ncbi:OLC1v1028016C1 [Oldenlandia corymbosa var. corymbosa]|uniref:OLC1v1028016C1 n=1 Tax=Oldenlandia corymbosa var. corymbosa TaxID=529605 RepID=A0AAV1CAR7_OLDCO|nr:OLC1v1028016C1 [Oldenlandia corymbosa var. corymbosa]
MLVVRSSWRKTGNRFMLLITVSLLVLLQNTEAEWLNHGGDITNRREAKGEILINPKTATNLRLKWRFISGFDTTATPAVYDGVVYFPSWNGYLFAVREDDGSLIWKKNLGQLTGLPGPVGGFVNITVSRSAPTIADDLLIVGIYGPAVVIAVRRSTGQLVWQSQLDPNPRAIITTSGTYLFGAYYVGVSSLEELLPPSQCCTFRGSMAKLDARIGSILWQTYTVPDNGGNLGGYSGAAIWGSSPAIDVGRRLVYVATGNLYNAPQEVLDCQAAQNNQTTPPTAPDACVPPEAHFNSILAFDIKTGLLRWFKRLGGYDVFYLACTNPNSVCPPGPNPDADFGEAPMLLTIKSNGRLCDIAVAVQKSGFAWALDRDNGDIVWFTKAGPGSDEGGGTWGAATDGKRVYTNIVNGDRLPFTLAPSTQTTTFGAWVAMDANNGQILWTTANPSNETCNGPVTIVNGVLFAGSVASDGPFYAMDANTGRILWSYSTGATIYGGASASKGCVFVGNGYSVGVATLHPTWTSGNSVLAFCAL